MISLPAGSIEVNVQFVDNSISHIEHFIELVKVKARVLSGNIEGGCNSVEGTGRLQTSRRELGDVFRNNRLTVCRIREN